METSLRPIAVKTLFLEPLLSLQVDSFSLLPVRPFAFSTVLLTFIRNCVIPVVQICLVDERHLTNQSDLFADIESQFSRKIPQ